MMIALHKNSRTTPAIRAEIAVSTDSAATLAQRFGIGESTVYKWKARDSFYGWHSPKSVDKYVVKTEMEKYKSDEKKYALEFKDEAVRQVIDRGHPVVDVAKRLGISESVLYTWVSKFK
jgi:transposase-like protein